jgi:nitroreductase
MLGAGNKYRTIDASGIAVFCSDLRPGKRVDRIHDLERDGGMREDGYMAVMRVASTFLTGEGGGSGSGGGGGRLSAFAKRTFADALSPVRPMPTMEDAGMWSYKNAGIASQMYTMAATAHGLSTCMMEGYDARRAMEILRVPPERYGLPIMVATGYGYDGTATPASHADDMGGEDDAEEEGGGSDDKRPTRTPRLGMNELFFGDTFGEPLDFLRDGNTQSERENAA